jgi:hypothetical protein
MLGPRDVLVRVSCFTLVAYAWSWLLWYGERAYLRGWTDIPVPPTPLPFFGPAIAAIAVTLALDGSTATASLIRRLTVWWLPLKLYAVAFLLPLVIAVCAASLAVLRGECCERPVGVPTASWILLFFARTLFTGGPLGEELGWRGFLLPLLAFLGARRASLIVGLLWFGWHLPSFWMAGSVQTAIPMASYATSMLAGSVVITWLFVAGKGSLLPPLLLHTSVNWSQGLLTFVLPGIQYSSSYQTADLMLGTCVAIGLFVFSGLFRDQAMAAEVQPHARESRRTMD